MLAQLQGVLVHQACIWLTLPMAHLSKPLPTLRKMRLVLAPGGVATRGVMSCIVRPPSVVVNSLRCWLHWDLPAMHWPLATVNQPRSAVWKSMPTTACCEDRLGGRRSVAAGMATCCSQLWPPSRVTYR